MKHFKIVCRSSMLSVVQANIARDYLLQAAPTAKIDIILKETSGDANQSRPLYEMEGRDFFSKEIDEILLNGEADFAVHSMKDLSAEHIEDKRFFNAVPERNDPRDIAIFNADVIQKIKEGKQLVVGTSSLRRQLQAISFLQKALPVINGKTAILETKPIRGNVDTRLRQLQDGKFDVIILAAAGLNRLLKAGNTTIAELLQGKSKMLLPLIECAPAPGQGALLINALTSNLDAVNILQSVNNKSLSASLAQERNCVKQLGGGCHQQYGAIHLSTANTNFTNISGLDIHGNDVSDMLFDIPIRLDGRKLFAATDFMKDFFSYQYLQVDEADLRQTVFVTHHRAVVPSLVPALQIKNVWCSGTRTWFELAKLGIWCQGCADGLGFDFLLPVFQQPLMLVNLNSLSILTHLQAKQHWKESEWHLVTSYVLVPDLSESLVKEISEAEMIYWTNFEQYTATKHLIKNNAIHLCPSGKTATLFEEKGCKPIVFPGIKAFNVWRKKNTQ